MLSNIRVLTLAILLQFLTVVFTYPVEIEPPKAVGCSANICLGDTKFFYEKGQTYVYEYVSETLTRLNKAGQDEGSLNVKARVEVESLGPCELALHVYNAEVTHSGTRIHGFEQDLQANPLRFSFQEGQIPHICPTPTERPWALNVKRAMLTAFQNNMQHFGRDASLLETDITGECMTKYTVTHRGYDSVTFKKSRDLLGCTSRHGNRSVFQAMPYRVRSSIQSMPLTKSTHECVQTIYKGSHLGQSECTENHVFRPFANQDAGAMTTARQTLKYLSQQRKAHQKQTEFSSRQSLLFDHQSSRSNSESARDDAVSHIRNICKQAPHHSRKLPQMFSELIYRLRELDVPSLKNVHNTVHRQDMCQHARHYFHDAVPMVGTEASVALIKDLIVRPSHVSGLEATNWLTSLSFIAEPTHGMLTHAKDLLTAHPTRHTILAVSALTHTYCHSNADCVLQSEVQEIVRSLEAMLGSNCATNNKAEYTRVLVALKALSNIGHGVQSVDTLQQCFQTASNPMEIRLAAMSVFRRMAGNFKKLTLIKMFQDRAEDAEIRIAAYQTLMRFATPEIIEIIKTTLENEKSNQVGSFVWTHLTNLMESSNPHKSAIRDILENEILKKEFNLDKRKFSRNYEGSFFLESLNMGANLDSNLIWSERSYIPRSAMMNLTVDLFGSSVNLVEFGGRIEGMESMVEKMFGPEGYFSKDAVKDVLSRRTRSTGQQSKLERVHKSFNAKRDEMRGSAYMKIFGTEIGFLDSVIDNDLLKNKNTMEMLMALAKGDSIDYSKSVQLIDSSLTIPTITGIPMKLSVEGTASVHLVVKGKLDLRKAKSPPRSVLLSGELTPSSALELSSKMSVDAHYTSAELRMSTNLYSSMSARGEFNIQDGQVLIAKLDLPQKQNDIFHFQNRFYVNGKEQKMTGERKEKELCTGNRVDRLLDLKLCASLMYHNASKVSSAPYFPLTGPVEARVQLKKTNPGTKYEMEARWERKRVHRPEDMPLHIKINLDTPGSKVNRKVLFRVKTDKQRGLLKVNMQTPWKTADLDEESAAMQEIGPEAGDGDLKDQSAQGMKSRDLACGIEYSDVEREWHRAAEILSFLLGIFLALVVLIMFLLTLLGAV